MYIITGLARLSPVSDCTENYRPVLSSERALYMKKKVDVKERKLKSGQRPEREPDTKRNWLTDRRSQYTKLELELEQGLSSD
jgi:hypothetical protein